MLDDILTPMERNVKAYLVAAVSKDLLELLALMAVERPDDPHLWLGSKLLERSPNGPYLATKRSAYALRAGRAGQGDGPEGAAVAAGGGGGGGALGGSSRGSGGGSAAGGGRGSTFEAGAGEEGVPPQGP